MIPISSNPIKPGVNLIWRGWRRLFARVQEVGVPAPVDDTLLVPVRYTNGEYAVVVVTIRMKHNGHEQFEMKELCPENQECYDAIRTSKGIPDIIMALSGCFKIGVTDGLTDYIVFVRRSRTSVVSEQVVVAPR